MATDVTTKPTGICPRCHKPWDDHNGYRQDVPRCPR